MMLSFKTLYSRVALYMALAVCCYAFPVTLQAQFTTRQTVVTAPPVEEGTPVEARFALRNLSLIPVYIDTAFADCGVIVKGYPHTAIQPGHNFTVTATVRTKGRVGKYAKDFSIRGLGFGNPLKLRMEGTVTLPSIPPAAFRDTTGSLVWDKTREAVGALTGTDTFAFRCKNIGATPLSLVAQQPANTPFAVWSADSAIAPGKTGVVRISYTPAVLTSLDQKRQREFMERFTLQAGNQPVQLYLTGVLNLSYSDSLLRIAPVAVWAATELQVGSIAPSTQPLVAFQVRNNGRLPLLLSPQVVPGDCLELVGNAATNNVVQPGGTGRVVVRIRPDGRKGPLHRTITVQQNDPNAPSVVLHVRAWL
jgi:hypothetical protein